MERHWFRRCAAFLLLCLLLNAAAGPIYSYGIEKVKGFDLSDVKQREQFLGFFRMIPKVDKCAIAADFAVKIMKERDSGVSIETHMDKMRELYNEHKNISRYSVYVDLKRLVNDVHRTKSVSAGGGFRFEDSNKFWKREFEFCFGK